MKRMMYLLLVLLAWTGQTQADEYLFRETFANVSAGGTPLDIQYYPLTEQYMAQFDNPEGWAFENAFVRTATKGRIYLKKGGSMTLPAIQQLTGNATFRFGINNEHDGETFPHPLSITNGELNVNELDLSVSMGGGLYMFDVGPDTRLTLTASNDIIVQSVEVFYPRSEYIDGTKFSHEPGVFVSPFDLTLTPATSGAGYDDDGSHNILVYTLDGSKPQRTSTRYNGTPIRITGDTKICTATIYGTGAMSYGKEQVYTLYNTEPEIPEVPASTFEVTVENPGTLRTQLLHVDADVIEGLVVKGKINGADLNYLAGGEGRMASLAYLDMSETSFEYDDTEYRIVINAPEAGMGTTYEYHYFLSETNYDERKSPKPDRVIISCYRNDLSCAFYKHPALQHVVLPKDAVSIGNSLFYGCAELRYAEFPSGRIDYVGSEAFRGCSNFKADYILPTVKEIGSYAFAGAKLGLLKVDHEVKIGEGAFSNSEILEVDLPYPADTLKASTFDSCDKLKKVTIGDGLAYMGDNAFGHCSKLAEINIGKGLKYVGASAFAYTLVATADFLSEVEEVGYRAFIGCPFVEQIEPEEGIRYIGKVAYEVTDKNRQQYTVKDGTVSLTEQLFFGCKAGDFIIPASVKVVGKEAFACTSITSMPDMPGVERIMNWAFRGCEKLARVVIPETVTYMDDPFYDCNAMWSVTYNAIDAECSLHYRNFANVEQIIIGDKVRRLPNGLFERNAYITEVNLPASIEKIDARAFNYCSSLQTVNIPGRIKSLGEYVFANCPVLVNVAPIDVEIIPTNAFSGCNSLPFVYISDRVRVIEDGAFSGCKSLADIHWSASLEKIGGSAFSSCENLEVVSLPEGVTQVGNSAFSSCKKVHTVYIPSTLKFEGDYDSYQQAFKFLNDNAGASVTCMLATPPVIKDWYWTFNNRVACVKVPAAQVDTYKNDTEWEFFKDMIVPVEQLETPTEESETSFDSGISEDADLNDTVVGDVYVTLGEDDGYDASDGSIVLNSSMDPAHMDAIGGMTPGESDLANRFNGLVVQVPAGEGTVSVDCQTIGSKLLCVKIGEAEPQTYTKDEKGNVDIAYQVAEDTYIYIYGVEEDMANMPSRTGRAFAPASENYIKVYSIRISPMTTGITGKENQSDSTSPITEYYTTSGVQVERPTTNGLYIVRRADGTASKIWIK